jgi:FtsH-binding integral membrane protein
MSQFPSERSARARFGTITGELSTGLLGKVFGLLAFSMAFAAAGGVVGYRLDPVWIMPMFLVELGLIFAVQGLREREGVNFVLLYAFAFVSGVTLGPILAAYVGAGLGTVVLEAAAVTGAMTVGLSAYALTTKRSLLGLQPFLFMALLGLIVAMLVNIFVGGTVMYTMLSWGGALLFSLLLVVDVQRAKYAPDTMGNAVVLTLGIYLDIVNLFLFVLRILQGGARR